MPSGGGLPAFPEMLRFVEAGGRLSDMPPARQRALEATFASVSVADVRIPGIRGDVAARAYRPPGVPRGGLVWIHGGAFIGGDLDSPETHWFSLHLAARGISVLAVDYRKAVRGVAYPVPFDDCLSAWNWAVVHAARVLGVDGDGLFLGGASAGGDLAACVAKKVRDGQDATRPSALVLAYPWLHPEAVVLAPEEMGRAREGAAGLFFEAEDLTAMSYNYARVRSALRDPYAFAAVGSAQDLPPTLIVTAEFDSIRASGEAFARALDEEGVDVTLVMDPGVAHGIIASPLDPAARASVTRIADWICERVRSSAGRTDSEPHGTA